jgi:prepilin-type N-terminal cleavage/methylation domain-containing protein
LIELLVVMAIIGILASMIFAGANAVRDAARRKKAATFEQTLVHAIRAYRNDFDKWPGQTASGADFCQQELSAMCKDLTNNPRGILYIEFPPNVVSNFAGSVNLMDPWLSPYCVVMDYSGDGALGSSISPLSISFGGTTLPATNVQNETVGVISWGSKPSGRGARFLVCTWDPNAMLPQ